MGTKPGVGEESVIIDLPSEAGAAVETDQLLSRLAPGSADFVERQPAGAPGDGTPAVVPGPNGTVAGRSAKTRVAGVPVLQSAGSAHSPLHVAGREREREDVSSSPSQTKRVVAFMASVGMSLAVGLPVVLQVNGLGFGGKPVASQGAPAAVPSSPVTHPIVEPPVQKEPASATPPATVASPNGPTTPAAKPSQKAGPAGPGVHSVQNTPTPPNPPAVAVSPQHPPTAPVSPTPPPTPPTSAPTIQHGSLLQ